MAAAVLLVVVTLVNLVHGHCPLLRVRSGLQDDGLDYLEGSHTFKSTRADNEWRLEIEFSHPVINFSLDYLHQVFGENETLDFTKIAKIEKEDSKIYIIECKIQPSEYDNFAFLFHLLPGPYKIQIVSIKLNNMIICKIDSLQCGEKMNSDDSDDPVSLPLVVGGEETSIGDWPWLVALFKKFGYGVEFICGGSLVSTNIVITAAHCVQIKRRYDYRAHQLVVHAGRYSMDVWGEDDLIQSRDVDRVIIPRQYNHPRPLDNDLAVLTLRAPVQFSPTVQPICLWDPSLDVPLYGINGSVVGWGKDNKGNIVTVTPMLTTMPIVTQEECLNSNPSFLNITSNNTFCAGNRDDTGPCSGDSGGGFYINVNYPDGRARWVLRGLVSQSLLKASKQKSQACDLSNYIVFTDMRNFIQLVKKIQDNNKPYIDEFTSETEQGCLNTCDIKIHKYSAEIAKIRKKNDDVQRRQTEIINALKEEKSCHISMQGNTTQVDPNSSSKIYGCGRARTSSPLIVEGSDVDPDDWPWIAAVWIRKQHRITFKCGGTLISRNVVVTAANCVGEYSGYIYDPSDILIYLGAYNISEVNEVNEEQQLRKMSEIIIHPSYLESRRRGINFAILVLERPVDYTERIQPICLWEQTFGTSLDGVTGTVVGWGLDGLGVVTDKPKLTEMPIVPNEVCLNSHRGFTQMVTENTFCAGKRDGSGPCHGDSGNGMFVLEKFPGGENRWVLRGIVSTALKSENYDDGSLLCDLSNYVVLTDVAKATPWLLSGLKNYTIE